MTRAAVAAARVDVVPLAAGGARAGRAGRLSNARRRAGHDR